MPKWPKTSLIILTISASQSRESVPTTLRKSEIEKIYFDNRIIVEIALRNKRILDDKISIINDTIKELQKAEGFLRFLLSHNIPDENEVKIKLRSTNLASDDVDFLISRIKGSYFENIPKIGVDKLLRLNLNHKYSILLKEEPSENYLLGIRRTF